MAVHLVIIDDRVHWFVVVLSFLSARVTIKSLSYIHKHRNIFTINAADENQGIPIGMQSQTSTISHWINPLQRILC